MSHDIYTSPKHANRDRAFRSDTRGKPSNPWTSLVRRRRLQTLVTLLLFILITSLVVVITFQQHLLNTAPAYDTTATTTTTTTTTTAPRTEVVRMVPATRSLSEASEEDAFVLDELRDLDFTAEEDGAKPLHSRWIKQATYHVLQAERARRDGLDDIAIDHYEKALALYPGLQDVHATVGMMHMDRGDFDSAIRSFERAMDEGIVSFGVVNNLAVAYLQLSRWDDARDALVQTVELRPSYAPAHYNLATLYVRLNQPDEASRYFDSFLQLEPEHLNAMLSYAALLVRQDQWQQAAPMLERAARLSPRAPPIQFRLAQSYANTDRASEAIAILRSASRLVDARNALGWMSRGEFDPLRTHPEFTALQNELTAAQR